MKKLILAFLLPITFNLLAQKKDSTTYITLPNGAVLINTDYSAEHKKYLPNFSPKSPNTASLFKHGDYQVNYATAVPNIEIDLFSAQDGAVSIAPKLRYHAGGHKLDALAGATGLGWSLDLGASVNRSINGGMTDDDGVFNGLRYLKNPIIDRNLCASGVDYSYALNVNLGSNDIEPDLFSYSIPETGGRFFLGQDVGSNHTDPFLMPYQPVKINPIYTGGTIKSFEIIGTNGTTYFFGDDQNGNSATETQIVYNNDQTTTGPGINNWHLTKILAPNSNDAIFLSYQNANDITHYSKTWSTSFRSNVPVEAGADDNITTPSAIVSDRKTTQKNVKSITYTNGRAEFIYSALGVRTDQPESAKLEKIEVYHTVEGTESLLKTITFNYSYFKNGADNDGHLKLDGLSIKDANLSESLDYLFDYHTNNYSWTHQSNRAPSNAGNTDLEKQDFFGFYNGIDNDHLITADFFNNGFVEVVGDPVDRSTVTTFMKQCVLSKITYPSKGYTTFDFETNQYKDGNTIKYAGGLRVSEIKNYNVTTGNITTKRYTYSSDDGIGVGKIPTFWTPATANAININAVALPYTTGGGTQVDAICQQNIVNDNGWSQAQSHDGTPIFYTEVKEYFDPVNTTENNGYIKYEFNFYRDHNEKTPQNPINDIQPWRRGQLEKKTVYDRAGTAVETTTYTNSIFKISSITNAAVVKLNAKSTVQSCSSGMPNQFIGASGFYDYFKYYKYPNKTGQSKVTQTITLKDGVSTTETVAYDDYLLPISSITDDSYTNHFNIQTTKYPTDASYIGDPVATLMRSRNMIAEPLETEESENLNGTINIISKQKNILAEFTGTNGRGLTDNILPSQIQIAPNGNSLETRVEFTEYDTDGNPLEYKVDGVPTSVLWGYGGSSLVALIKNATKAEVDVAKTTASIDLADFNVTNLSSTLLAKVTAFQNALPDAQASWYTHIPQVGISEMIAINGLKSSFEYDDMQRLKLSKDNEGNLLALNQYNFGLNPSITSSVFRVPTTNTADANSTTKANISISYFDGLGRDLQKVAKQQSPLLKDIVSNAVEYDSYGRVFKSYLAAPTAVATGVYQPAPQVLGSTFYDDSRPFSQVLAYDNSPLNREKETMGPGQNWKNTDPNLDKKVKHFYETNGVDEVRYYYLDASNNIKKSGYYPTNSLYKKRKLDEESHETISYTDKRGRQILTQQQDDSGYITTYYLYDGAGRTRAIIQPEGYLLDATIDYNTDNWNRWVFEYQYDARGRQIEKKVPGAAKEYFVYDKWDRLIMSQDGYQAEKGFWKFNKYDALDRNIYAGIKTDGNSRSTHQTNANNTVDRYESKNDTEPYYSLSTTYPTVSVGDIWLANYFDDYTKFRTTDTLKFIAGQTESTLYANTRGQLTGSYERSSIDNAWLKSANYYDSKNRLIQSRKIHHLSINYSEPDKTEADVNSIEYNFAGDVVKQIGNIKKTGVSNLPFSNQNNVDLLGRITGNFHTVKTLQQNIATYIYDEINRIKTKNIGLGGTASSQADGNWNEPSVWNGYFIPNLNNAVTIDHNINVPENYKGYSGLLTLNGSINFDPAATLQLAQTTSNTLLQKIDIQHHIRGGLLGVNLDAGEPSVANDGDLFSFKLNHGFDGNITLQSWKDKTNNEDRAWTYAYDPSSRIKSATYTPSGTYNVSGITYDKNGNIKTLNRSGVDALTYDYTDSGNLLLKVTDGTTGNTDVGDFRNGTNSGNDYEYYTDGSLKLDRNKTIKTIEYDPFHKKVKYVEFDDGKWNKFDYAGNGSLIKRQNSTGEYWDYTANIIYKNGVAYQMNTAEGRTVYNGTAWEYEFEYRDHNEDLRLSFKNENGLPTIVQQNTNDIWGWEIKGLSNVETGNSTQSNFRFLDRESVFETGWVNLNNRMVDPQLGRFISQDKITAEQENYSLYQYGWNNPVLRSDPTGNWPGEGLWNKIKEGVKSASAWAGSVFTESSNLRKTYQAESAKLTEKTPENNLKRLELKANVRDATPQPIKAMLDKNRPMSGETAKVKAGAVNNPSKTNSSVNSLAEKFGTAGKVVTGVGVAISVTNIATSANPMNQVGIEAGGWAGAYTGGVLAAEAAAPSGNPYVIGASGLVGSIVGGVFGQEAVKQVQSIPRVPLFTLLPR